MKRLWRWLIQSWRCTAVDHRRVLMGVYARCQYYKGHPGPHYAKGRQT